MSKKVESDVDQKLAKYFNGYCFKFIASKPYEPKCKFMHELQPIVKHREAFRGSS